MCVVCLFVCVRDLFVMLLFLACAFVFCVFEFERVCCVRVVCVVCLCLFLVFGFRWSVFVLRLFHYMFVVFICLLCSRNVVGSLKDCVVCLFVHVRVLFVLVCLLCCVCFFFDIIVCVVCVRVVCSVWVPLHVFANCC